MFLTFHVKLSLYIFFIKGFVEDGGWEPVLEDEDGEEDEDSALEGDSDFEV